MPYTFAGSTFRRLSCALTVVALLVFSATAHAHLMASCRDLLKRAVGGAKAGPQQASQRDTLSAARAEKDDGFWREFMAAERLLEPPQTLARLQSFPQISAAVRAELGLYLAARPKALSAGILEFLALPDAALRAQMAKLALAVDDDVSLFIGAFELEPQDRLAAALVAAEKVREPRANPDSEVAHRVQDFEITDADELMILARQIVRHKNSYRLLENLDAFQMEDEARRMELALFIGEHDPHRLVSIKRLRITEQENIIRLAWLFARGNAELFSQSADEFPIEDENVRIELAEYAASKYGHNVAMNLADFRISSAEGLRRIAWAAARSGGGVSSHIKLFKLTEEERIAIAREVLKQPPRRGSYDFRDHLADYEISDPEIEFEIALTATRKIGYWFVAELAKFHIEDPAKRLALARAAIETSPEQLVMINRQVSDARLTRVFGSKILYENLVLAFKHLSPLQAKNFEMYVNQVRDVRVPYMYMPPDYESRFTVLRRSLENLGSPMSKEQFDILGSTYRSADILGALYVTYDIALRTGQTELIDGQTPQEIAFGLLGFSKTALPNFLKLSIDSQSDFVALALEIQSLKGAFRVERIADELFTRRGIREITLTMNMVRDLRAMGVKDAAIVPHLQDGLSFANIHAVNGALNEHVAEVFSKEFQIQNRTMTVGELSRLTEEWGDLSVVRTLLARFRGASVWRDEIPVLGRIVDYALQGRFAELKFKGIGKADEELAARQVRPLKGHIEAWMRPRSRIELESHGSEEEIAKLKRNQIQELMATNILLHLSEAFSTAEYEALPPREEALTVVRAIPLSGDPRAWLQEQSPESRRGLLPAIGMAISTEMAQEVPDMETVTRWVGFVRANAETLVPTDDLASDFKQLSQLLGQVPKDEGRGISLTVLTHDPLQLMRIGDAVAASSCQNYKIGSHVQTLLGYVLDAGVQALLSFSLRKEDFKDPADYVRLVRAVKAGGGLEATLDAQTRVRIQGAGFDIQSKNLGKAYARRMLKLGETDKGLPGLRMERSYTQIHNALPQMLAQMQSITDEIAEDIGAGEGRITIPKSRNPGGVYSDLAHGEMIRDYCLD